VFVAGQISNAATANGWGYVGFSMQLAYSDIVPIFVVVFSSLLLSEETGAGTIRSVLAAPVHRWELYLAKAVIGLVYMMVLTTAALLFSILLGAVNYPFGAVGDAFGEIYTREQAVRSLIAAQALSWIPMAALVMYGLLISAIVRSPGAAVASGISLLIVIDLTKHLVGIDPYIFTRHINFPWLTLQQIAQGMGYQWAPEVWNMISLSGISAAVTFVAGLVLFVRQDLNH
jgi:ABC-2 type transport system permease protein